MDPLPPSPESHDSEDVPSRLLPRDKRTGREIAYGIQQTLACWVTDFIDPPVSKWFQNKFGNKNHPVTNKHVWWAEGLGDSSAFFVYVFIKRAFTKPLDALTVRIKNAMDGRFTKMGKKALKPWQEQHHIDENDPRYQHKLELYKEFQAENVVDSTIIATTATLGNVGIQRQLGNRQNLHVILASKIVGAAMTMSLMLGLRTGLPTATKTLDDELSERYFSKIVRFTKRMFGIHDENASAPAAAPVSEAADIPTERVSLADAPLVKRPLPEERRQAFLAYLHRAFTKRDASKKENIATFIEQQKTICDTFIHVLNPSGRFAQQLAESHRAALLEIDAAVPEKSVPEGEFNRSVELSVQSILLNRRDDMLARKTLLNDGTFREELIKLLATPAPPKTLPKALPVRKQEELIESLAQTTGAVGREPAVHIYANAKGQWREHKALAEIFDPQKAPAEVLAQELGKWLPSIDKESILALARDYVQDRQHPAKLVVEAMTIGSPILEEAMRRSEQKRRESGKTQDKTTFLERVQTPQANQGGLSWQTI